MAKPGVTCRIQFALAISLAGAVAGVAAQAPAPTPDVAASATEPYQDRVIQGPVTPDSDEAATGRYDSSGALRGYSLESVYNQRRSQDQGSSSLGLQASAYFDTLQYGSLSGQATLGLAASGAAAGVPNHSSERGLQSWTLRQIGMPFDGGWRANNSIGMLFVPVPDLARNSPRLGLPGPSMRGFVTQWQNGLNNRNSANTASGPKSLELTAAWGEAGDVQGFPLGRFGRSQGEYGLLAGQFQSPANRGFWQGAAALGLSRGARPTLGPSTTMAQAADTDSLFIAARREWLGDAPAFVQANTVGARSSEVPRTSAAALPSSRAVWVDAGLRSGAHNWNAGVFKLDPNLAWIDTPMANDLRGAQLRHTWQTRQWQTEANLELLDSVSGLQRAGYFASASLRHQFSSRISLGGAATLRRFGSDAQGLMLFGQWGSGWGNTRAQWDVASSQGGERLQRLQLDHDWSSVQALRLATSLSLERQRNATATSRSVGAAVNADWDLGSNFSTSHSLQSRFGSGTKQYTLSSGVTWRLAPGWSLLGNVYASTGSADTPAALAQSPLTPPATQSSSAREQGVFVALRYQQDAGRVQVPLGGVRGQGAGRLEGSVYLDTNKSATRDASERGAAGVTVLLNGRFAAQTDAQGRFEFAFVAAGEHVLTVVADNLPLPWTLDKAGRSDARTPLRIYTRETTRIDIGATQP